MATNRTQDTGVIILGNAGTGKSFLCNIILGIERFEAAFRPKAVTKETEYHRVNGEGHDLLIFNIPGLIEAKQERIDKNKKEIMKAFAECPNSIVLFVWGHVGGRVQKDDIIAFKALNEAYQFPQGSLAFVVNNLEPNRKATYDADFIVVLEMLLAPRKYARSDFIFIDKLDPDSEDARSKYNDARLQLFKLIESHTVARQKQVGDIVLQADQLEKLRVLLKQQEEDARKNAVVFQEKMNQAIAELSSVKEESRKQMKALEKGLKAMAARRQEDLSKEVRTMRKEIEALKKDKERNRDEEVQRYNTLQRQLQEKEKEQKKEPDAFSLLSDFAEVFLSPRIK